MTDSKRGEHLFFSTTNFAELVRRTIANIPYGRVTTYGDIAEAIGAPRNARRVGWVMHGLPSDNELPCHRVVNRDGDLTGGWMWGHPDIMKGLLLDEGVPFVREHRVDLAKCRWFPQDELDLAPADHMDDFDLIAGGDPS
jgi:methylated-DNA-protein-cysteine methyltransferase related protein